MATTETRKMVMAAAAVCEDKKAENTRVLELDPADSGFTDFFLITSGANPRQTVAIADEIELKMKREFATYANSVEGRRQGEWILMDYVDFVVHIFVEEKRAFYDIERLRKSARRVDLAELETALTRKTAAARKSHPRPAAQADPSPDMPSGAAPPVEPDLPARKSAPGKKTAAPRKTAATKSRRSTARTGVGSAGNPPAKKSATRIAAADVAAAGKAAAGKAAAKRSAKKSSTSRSTGPAAE